MTWTARVLRGADDLHVRPFEPCTTSATIVVDTCGQSNVTAQTVLEKLASSDTNLGVRIQQGLPAQFHNGSAWLNLDPTLDTGPMLVRNLHVAEHDSTANLWVATYDATGFGPPIDGAPQPLGSPNISVATAHRPRTANAYRVRDPSGATPLSIPTDVLAGTTPDTFTRTPWHTGVDIGGLRVDVNTSPLSVAIDQTVVTIQWVARWPYEDWSGWQGRVNLGAANEYIGGRNRCTFLQFPIGTLLCESIDVQPLHHEFKLVTFVCVYDEWKHAHQVPLTAAQFYTPTFIDPTTAMSQAFTVLWVQPYLDSWCLVGNGILNPQMEAYLERFEVAS